MNTSSKGRDDNPTTSNTTEKVDISYRPAHSGLARIYDISDPKAPFFPQNYNVIKNAVLHVCNFFSFTINLNLLQFTDLSANINKYYGMEIHEARENGKFYYRVYTTYGKTDDLLAHNEGKINYHVTVKSDTNRY